MKFQFLKLNHILLLWMVAFSFTACAQKHQTTVTKNKEAETIKSTKTNKMTWNKLTPEEERVIVHKGTEYPGTGALLNNSEKGTYVCKR
ncbi:MAG: peptide-methionine (R)-S-oxide reductase, partial [Ginsengibacter sp.]